MFHSVFSSAHDSIQYFPVLMENTIDHIIFQCSWFHSVFSSANEKYYCRIIVFSSGSCFIQYFQVLMKNIIVDHSIFQRFMFHSSAHAEIPYAA